eukprot:TRINITY_DN65770_c0_g1_i1.p1 TRINITY_DN65770_c0_g1~~TRINITY_DN65770_c0_g1_i1.p1  ORF type:complete len:364 (-),score=37.84 TRINITY_DN65770_c0_g1_i1:68-1159(-)
MSNLGTYLSAPSAHAPNRYISLCVCLLVWFGACGLGERLEHEIRVSRNPQLPQMDKPCFTERGAALTITSCGRSLAKDTKNPHDNEDSFAQGCVGERCMVAAFDGYGSFKKGDNGKDCAASRRAAELFQKTFSSMAPQRPNLDEAFVNELIRSVAMTLDEDKTCFRESRTTATGFFVDLNTAVVISFNVGDSRTLVWSTSDDGKSHVTDSVERKEADNPWKDELVDRLYDLFVRKSYHLISPSIDVKKQRLKQNGIKCKLSFCNPDLLRVTGSGKLMRFFVGTNYAFTLPAAWGYRREPEDVKEGIVEYFESNLAEPNSGDTDKLLQVTTGFVDQAHETCAFQMLRHVDTTGLVGLLLRTSQG